MSLTLDERARDASAALHAAVEMRPPAEPGAARTRAPVRVLVTAALLVLVIAVAAVLALRAASPRKGGVASQPNGRYEARALLISAAVRPSADPARVRKDALLFTVGVVPTRAHAELGGPGDPAQLAAQVHTVIDARAGTITLVTRQSTGERALRVVNVFGRQFIAYLDQIARNEYEADVAGALGRVRSLQQQLAAATQQLDTANHNRQDGTTLEARRESLMQGLSSAQRQYGTVAGVGAGTSRYRLIESVSVTALPAAHRHSSNTTLRATLIALAALALLMIGYVAGHRRRTTASQT